MIVHDGSNGTCGAVTAAVRPSPRRNIGAVAVQPQGSAHRRQEQDSQIVQRRFDEHALS